MQYNERDSDLPLEIIRCTSNFANGCKWLYIGSNKSYHCFVYFHFRTSSFQTHRYTIASSLDEFRSARKTNQKSSTGYYGKCAWIDCIMEKNARRFLPSESKKTNKKGKDALWGILLIAWRPSFDFRSIIYFHQIRDTTKVENICSINAICKKPGCIDTSRVVPAIFILSRTEAPIRCATRNPEELFYIQQEQEKEQTKHEHHSTLFSRDIVRNILIDGTPWYTWEKPTYTIDRTRYYLGYQRG